MLRLQERYKKKHEKYSKALDRLTWLIACSSGLSVASEILSIATLSTLIGLPVCVPLVVVSLAGVSARSVATVVTKKYQKKLAKVTKLVDIIISVSAVFETSISKALNNHKIDEREFTMLQVLHLGAINELANVDHKMKRKTRPQLQNSLLEEINNLKTSIRRDAS